MGKERSKSRRIKKYRSKRKSSKRKSSKRKSSKRKSSKRNHTIKRKKNNQIGGAAWKPGVVYKPARADVIAPYNVWENRHHDPKWTDIKYNQLTYTEWMLLKIIEEFYKITKEEVALLAAQRVRQAGEGGEEDQEDQEGEGEGEIPS